MVKLENILALDIGDARVGLAIANTIARIPSPLSILPNDEQIFQKINSLVQQHQISTIVVGLPRNMAGEETKQSAVSRQFAAELQKHVDSQITFADESLSTKRAEQTNPGKTGHLDDQAACFILDEYFKINQ